MPESYYDTLQVSREATPREITAAYRRMAVQWHPDKWAQREPALADAMFRSIAEAFVTLSDSDARQRYDARRHASDAGSETPERRRFADPLSSDAAVEIFFRQMEAFAVELAAEGLTASEIAQYLENFGCPEGIAKGLGMSIGGSALLPPREAQAHRGERIPGRPDTVPWPSIEPALAAYLSGLAAPTRLEGAAFDRAERVFRRAEIVLLTLLTGLAGVAIASGVVEFPRAVTLAIPAGLFVLMLGWGVVLAAFSRRHPGYRLERRLRREMSGMRAIFRGERAPMWLFSSGAMLGGPVWAASHRLTSVAVGWLLLLAAGGAALHFASLPLWWLGSVYALSAFGFGFAANRLRLSRALRAIEACGGALTPDLGEVARCGGRRPALGVLTLLAGFGLVAALVALDMDGLTGRGGSGASALPEAGMDSPAGLGVSDAKRAQLRQRAEQIAAAAEFNRLMMAFEARHPEFDPGSGKFDAQAAESLRARIESLEKKGLSSLEALQQASDEYEELLRAQARASSDAARRGARSGSATPPGPKLDEPAVQDNALKTLCETFPHACRR